MNFLKRFCILSLISITIVNMSIFAAMEPLDTYGLEEIPPFAQILSDIGQTPSIVYDLIMAAFTWENWHLLKKCTTYQKEPREFLDALIRELTTNPTLANAQSILCNEGNFYSPLFLACSMGMQNAVNILIIHGALVNAINDEDNTPLHVAAKGGMKNLEIVMVLLRAGADRNLRNIAGLTPADIARSLSEDTDRQLADIIAAF